MFFKYFSRQIKFSRIFQASPVYSSTFQACGSPVADDSNETSNLISLLKCHKIANFSPDQQLEDSILEIQHFKELDDLPW